jgi:cytoskeletal protein CcmA (bactofilin family)
MFGSRRNKGTTVVAREARFAGTLELQGDAHIEGHFEGVLQCEGELSIGPKGSVDGTLTANVVTVAGRVDGSVVARTLLRILDKGSVQGRVFYEALHVDAGGVVAGEVSSGPPPDNAELLPESTQDGAFAVAEEYSLASRSPSQIPPDPVDVAHMVGSQ